MDLLLDEAIQRWSAESFFRFDDQEPSCAVRILDHCLRAKRDDQTYEWLDVVAEWHQFDHAMMSGRASVASAKRPDLRFRIGDRYRLLEAKRLTRHSPLPGDYVDKGIARFTSGRYIVEDGRAAMLGFLIDDQANVVVPVVNTEIESRPAMSSANHLKHHRTVRSGYDLYLSSHSTVAGGNVQLTHHLVEVS